jgi:hypothetical protein
MPEKDPGTGELKEAEEGLRGVTHAFPFFRFPVGYS